MDKNIDLKAILYAHKKWLAGDVGAKCIDLRGADLSKASFRKKDLRKANFARANFEGANLSYADLSGANLSGANLHRAKIVGANFSGGVLSRCFAAFVNFNKCNLTACDLTQADLTQADMEGAVFGSDWESALAYARLKIIPEGDIIGWKKLRGNYVAKLLIPADARRSNAFGRRCRAEFVKTLAIIDDCGNPISRGISKRDSKFEYRVGEITRADDWDEKWTRDCSHGIHFFITYQEAEAL
jgi:hypothetical protein